MSGFLTVSLFLASSAMGAVTWQSQHVHNAGVSDVPVDLQVRNGYIYVGGNSDINNGSGFANRYYLLKYNQSLGSPSTSYYPTGNPQYAQRTLTSMAISLADNVALAGSNTADNQSLTSGLTTVLDDQLAFQWADNFDNISKSKYVAGVACDSTGDVFAAISQTVPASTKDGYVVEHTGTAGSRDR